MSAPARKPSQAQLNALAKQRRREHIDRTAPESRKRIWGKAKNRPPEAENEREEG